MKFEKLIEFSSWDFIFSMITFLVLFLILKHFFFEKVHNFMESRRKEVEDALDNAAEASRLADEKLADYEKKIAYRGGQGAKLWRPPQGDFARHRGVDWRNGDF